jgi:excisionase family DNA binding protein
MEATQAQYMTTREAAALLRVAEQTLRLWRWAGRGPEYAKIGGRCLYSRAGVEAWVAARMRSSTAQREAA